MNQDQIECRWAEGRLGNIAHRQVQVTSHRSFTETLQGYRIMPPVIHDQKDPGHDEPNAISSQ
jgi:hypothetical protein